MGLRHASVTATRIDLAGDHMARLLDLVATYGGVDALAAVAERGAASGGEGRAALPCPSARPRT